MDLIILPGEFLLARVRGSMASTVAAAGTMAVAGTVIMTGSVAKAGGTAEVNSTGTKASTAAEVFTAVQASREATSAAVARLAVAVGSMAAEVAGSTVEATGNYFCFFLSHLNGWQLKLPAVFLCTEHVR
jgi:hypothetical protein